MQWNYKCDYLCIGPNSLNMDWHLLIFVRTVVINFFLPSTITTYFGLKSESKDNPEIYKIIDNMPFQIDMLTCNFRATIVEINSGEEIRHWVGQSVNINVE